MMDRFAALNAMGELVALRRYGAAVELAERLDHESLASLMIVLVRMRAESQIEFFHCQDLSDDEAREQAAGFFRAGLGFPPKD